MLQSISKQPAPVLGGFAGWGALWRRLLQALSRRSPVRGSLEHLGSLPLTAQSSLALVRLNRETLLLGITPQGITLLTKGTEPIDAGAGKVEAKKKPSRGERPRPQELSLR